MKFCLSKLSEENKTLFNDMMNEIHIDLKWVYNTPPSGNKFYRAPDEKEEIKETREEERGTRMMVMIVMARPRMDLDKGQMFDGKIGMFPFLDPNRPKPNNMLPQVDEAAVKKMLLDQVLPAISKRWPRSWPNKTSDVVTLYINPIKPHPPANDRELLVGFYKSGIPIQWGAKPPESPDLNLLNLGMFQEFQSLISRKSKGGILYASRLVFRLIEASKVEQCFLTYQASMIYILTHEGNLNPTLPSLEGVEKVQLENLPESLVCSEFLVDRARKFVWYN